MLPIKPMNFSSSILFHDILLRLLRKRIDDEKFIGLIGSMLKAGVMEDRVHTRTYSGTPQGGIVSPILANIYLHELDMFMAERIAAFERGKVRATNPERSEEHTSELQSLMRISYAV